MEMWCSLMPSRVILLSVLAIVGQSVLAMDEQPMESMQSPRLSGILNGLDFNEPPQKRAYTYVSEYKRLPVYNFGIGKRWGDNADDKRGTAMRQYSFGLGKRTRQYSFGLGKRNMADDGQELNPLAQIPAEYYDLDALPPNLENLGGGYLEQKRGRPYNFGLGKRSVNYAGGELIGTGKRPNDLMSQRYHFGLGKRMRQEEDATQQ